MSLAGWTRQINSGRDTRSLWRSGRGAQRPNEEARLSSKKRSRLIRGDGEMYIKTKVMHMNLSFYCYKLLNQKDMESDFMPMLGLGLQEVDFKGFEGLNPKNNPGG
jgi:hypothetical protein